jgi:glycogen debranching enzyme
MLKQVQHDKIKNMDITKLAYNKAIEVITACSKSTGLYASGLPGGYEATWARDSMITTLGASLVGNKFKDVIAKSIALLAKNQTELGMIPNCVGSYNVDRQSDVTFNSVDAPLWFIIGNFVYAEAYQDKSLLKKYKRNIDLAFLWLRYQDPDNVGLIAQQPTADWEDAFPHKYGYVLHNHALYYEALKMLSQDKQAQHVKDVINDKVKRYCSLYNNKLGFYFPWDWKKHDNIREHEEWFDTAANLLAVVTGMATKKISKKVLAHIAENKIDRPYPCKAIWPPIKKGDKEWHDYFSLSDAREPFHYLNAGIWPYIGGFYVAALVKMKKFKKAEQELEKLAEANMQIIDNPGLPQYLLSVSKSKHIPLEELKARRQKEFNEWLDGKTGEPKGEPYQAWGAGMYLYAYECVKRKKILYF